MIPQSHNAKESAVFQCFNYKQDYLKMLPEACNGLHSSTCIGIVAIQQSIDEKEDIQDRASNTERCVDDDSK